MKIKKRKQQFQTQESTSPFEKVTKQTIAEAIAQFVKLCKKTKLKEQVYIIQVFGNEERRAEYDPGTEELTYTNLRRIHYDVVKSSNATFITNYGLDETKFEIMQKFYKLPAKVDKYKFAHNTI